MRLVPRGHNLNHVRLQGPGLAYLRMGSETLTERARDAISSCVASSLVCYHRAEVGRLLRLQLHMLLEGSFQQGYLEDTIHLELGTKRNDAICSARQDPAPKLVQSDPDH